MRRTFLILGLAIAVALGLIWLAGGMTAVERWAAASQREVQNALAGAIRALKSGQPGALAAFLALAFGYGVFHAAGPGHGKMLIGSYGAASRVRLLPLSAIAVAASLAQATVAVVLVYAGIFALGWTRERMEGVIDDVLTPLSYAAIAGIGLWLALRGWRHLRLADPVAATRPDATLLRNHGPGHDHAHHHHDHHHDHASHHHDHAAQSDDHQHGPEHDHHGHSHGPTLDQIAAVAGWRDAMALIAGIAIRPCTGALFVLILTWQIGIGATGVVAAYAMGLGTAAVTLLVAVLAVWAREGALSTLPGAGLARALPLLELAVGLAVALVAGNLLIGAL